MNRPTRTLATAALTIGLVTAGVTAPASADYSVTCSTTSSTGVRMSATVTRINYSGNRSAIKVTAYKSQKVWPWSKDEIWTGKRATGTGLQTRYNTANVSTWVTQWGSSTNSLDLTTRTVTVTWAGSGRVQGERSCSARV